MGSVGGSEIQNRRWKSLTMSVVIGFPLVVVMPGASSPGVLIAVVVRM